MGYGNPGVKYEKTRHNIGFMVLDEISERLNIKIHKNKFNALIGEGTYKNEKILLVKPQTYMNLSGESVLEIMNFYKVSFKDLIVIYDDIDLSFSQIRIKPRGSSGTHNGMRNITELLESNEFPRIRVGIGRPENNIELKDFVLMKFSKNEMETIEKTEKIVYNAIIEIIECGIESAMNLYNNKNEG